VSFPKEVDAIIEEARKAGARSRGLRERRSRGGYSGVFVDPDGHPWEIAHNPDWTLHPDGSISLE